MTTEWTSTPHTMTANAFWEWFQDNESYLRQELAANAPGQCPTIEDFANLLYAYEPNLSYVLSNRKKQSKKCRVTISTGGDKQYIMTVKHLVSQAPDLANWKVRAFIPPIKKMGKKFLNATLELDGQSLTVKDIKIAMTNYMDEEHMFEFTFVLPLSFANRDQDVIHTRLHFLMEDVLGEFKMLENILDFDISYQMDDIYTYDTIDCIPGWMEVFERRRF